MCATDEKNELLLFSPLIEKAQTLFNLAATAPAKQRFINAVKARMNALGACSITDYSSFLRRDDNEWAKLWPLALKSTGSFLFPGAQYEVAGELISQWAVMAPERSLRVLSLGCGPGYESVSLAILLEEIGLRGKNWQVEIYGVDLNQAAIEQASSGVYNEEDMQWLSDSRRRKWFVPRSGGWSFKRELAPPITYAAANAHEPEHWPFENMAGTFNLIFCRHLIREAPDSTVKKMPVLLRRLLAAEGFIFTAPGEFFNDVSNELCLEETAGVTYYRRGSPNKIKVNIHHTPRKKQRANTDRNFSLPPLNIREQSLLNEAKCALSEGRLEDSWELIDELNYSNIDRSRPSPEAWRVLADIQAALGRPEAAAAALKASEAFER